MEILNMFLPWLDIIHIVGRNTQIYEVYRSERLGVFSSPLGAVVVVATY